MRNFKVAILTAFSALAAVPFAAAHNHLTVDTPSGSPGEQAIIVTGYYAEDATISIDPDGHMLDGADVLVYDVAEELTGAGAQDGWAAADELTLTSDFFFATGRLNGGDFHYEIADVRPVSGGGAARAAWLVASSSIQLRALSSAATRLDRSFEVGIGGHEHGQIFAVSQQGVYDITLIAWDSNGVYADSEPVTFRVNVTAGPLPCAGDLNGDHVVDLADLGIILSDYGCTDGCVADWNNDGVVDLSDLGTVLAGYGQACP